MSTSELTPLLFEQEMKTSRGKFKEAWAWSGAAVGLLGYAALTHLINADYDVPVRGSTAVAVITGGFAYNSIKSARRLRQIENTPQFPLESPRS